MNKRIAKILSVLCAAALMVTTLAACGGGGTSSASGTSEESSKGSESSTASEDKPDKPSGEVPTLVWWLCGGTPANLADGLAEINAYAEEKIGVKIDIQVADWGDYDTKMNTIINGGDYYDIMFVNNTNYNRFVSQEKFLDITELAQEVVPDLYAFIPSLVWEGTLMGGRSYAVPTYKDSSISQYYVWDKAIADKYEIDTEGITTVQGLDAAFRAMKEGEGNSYYPFQINSEGLNGIANNYDDLTLGFMPIGVENSDKTRKVVSVLEQDDMMATLTQLHAWFTDGITNQDAPTLSEAPKGRPFFTAQAFPGADASYEISEGIEDYVMTKIYGPRYSTSSIQGSLNAISAASKYPNEALKFLELINLDPKVRNMLAYGVEGTNFEYLEENVVDKLDDTWNLATYQQATFFTLAAVTPNKGDQWDAVKELNEIADASTTLGFAMDLTKLTTEVANCNAIWAKYKNDMCCGALDPVENVPKIVDELKANGMDTIMTAAQEQIDAYFAAE